MVDPNPSRGMPLQLKRYWIAGKGAATIRWNTPGDFKRCVRALTKHFPKNPEGLCNILHTQATGGPPGHGSLEHSIDTAESLVAASSLLAAQPGLGQYLWMGPLAPIGKPTGEPSMVRIFNPGALSHRTLPLPLNHRRVTGNGHTGSVTVGRILGITYGPDENGNEFCWGWGDWLDPEYVPEAKEARYLVEQGVSGPSLDPGGQVTASVDPATGFSHMLQYVAGGATLVSIPAFAELRLACFEASDEDVELGEHMPPGMYDFDLDADEDCGCGDAMVAAVNPPGWRGLPLAARDSVFDNDDAIKRIAAWAGIGTEMPDVSKMKRAFMWHDQRLPETDPTAYRLPVGDIINGKLTMIFHAIYAAAALISGAHGGLPSINEEEKNQLRNQITEMYQAMSEDFGDSSIKAPWDRPMDQSQGANFAMADDASEPYGDVSYADPGYQQDGKKRYPIDTSEHIRAAWSYINQRGNAGKYEGQQVKAIKSKIMKAAEKAGIEISDSSKEYAIPLEPPGWWFSNPQLPGKTPLTVEPDGRVYGHLAAWNECHRDVGNRECVMAPRSKMDYRPFHLGQVRTAEGDTLRVGKIVQDTRHAGINLGYAATAIHYDDTGDEAAVVRAGEDEYGIWVAGAVVPDATPRKVAKLRRSPLSGDWRAVEGHLELTAALAVNVPAFPVYAMEGGDRLALTAAGTVYPDVDDLVDDNDDLVESVFAAFQTAVKEMEEEDDVEDDEDERDVFAAWIEDIKADEEIYAQRARAAQLAALLAAPMVPAPGATPVAPAAPVAGAPAPTDPNAPAPAAGTGEPTLEQQQFARQMNASFSIVQEADGSAPPTSAPASQAPASQQAPQAVAPVPAAPAPAQE